MVNWQAKEPMRWLDNKKAWMTGEYFTQYLRWFDSQMAGRRVLLLIDGFNAHMQSLQDDPLRNSTGTLGCSLWSIAR